MCVAPTDLQTSASPVPELRVQDYPWFSDVTRDKAEEMLMKLAPGTFLVRESRNSDSPYSLSVRMHDVPNAQVSQPVLAVCPHARRPQCAGQ